MTTIWMRHIREAKLCSGGTRAWFDKQGFSWADFLENGIPVEKFERTGDALALRVAVLAKKENSDG